MAKKVTLSDVADDLGISVSTVSRTLNNSILVSGDLRDRILSACGRLGYTPRITKRHESRTILNIRLFLPFREDADLGLYYGIGSLITGLRSGLQTKMNLVVDLNQEDTGIFDHKKSAQLDGCIFAFTTPRAKLLASVLARGIPTVVLNRTVPKATCVLFDNEGGMRRLVRELVQRGGRKRLAYLGFSAVKDVSDQRCRGIAAQCEEMGLPFGPKDVFNLKSLSAVDAVLVDKIASRLYDGVLCFNDNFAVAFAMAALRRNIAVPSQIALTGFDDTSIQALMGFKIDTVRLSSHRLGNEAGLWLRDAIIEKKRDTKTILVTGEYVKGSTIGA